MASAKELRQHAAEFLKLAQSASGEGKACLLAMARVWTQDAQDIERRNARGRGEHARSSPLPGHKPLNSCSRHPHPASSARNH
jgi:hypothetical protein